MIIAGRREPAVWSEHCHPVRLRVSFARPDSCHFLRRRGRVWLWLGVMVWDWLVWGD